MFLRKLSLALGLALLSTQASSLDIKTYEEMRNGPVDSHEQKLLTIHIAGLAEGFNFANADLEQRKLPPLFCAPRTLTLNVENYMQLVDESLTTYRASWTRLNMPIGGIILFALKMKMPCAVKP